VGANATAFDFQPDYRQKQDAESNAPEVFPKGAAMIARGRILWLLATSAGVFGEVCPTIVCKS
jgi:hypothetical protein